MKIVIREQNGDWQVDFSAVVEVDDRFGKILGVEYLQRHLGAAVAMALCDLKYPHLTSRMLQVNYGVLKLKDEITEGRLLALPCHEILNGNQPIIKKGRAE